MPPREYNDMAAIIQSALSPLVAEVQALKTKVDGLSTDRVTRIDIEKLRSEIVGSFVPRESYEPRHNHLIERIALLENMIREFRKEYDADMQRLEQNFSDRLKQQQEVHLSTKDRAWLRFTQIGGVVAIVIALVDFLAQHMAFR